MPEATQDEMEEAVQNSKEAFQTWKNYSVSRRARYMFRLRQLLEDKTVREITIQTNMFNIFFL